MLRRCAVLSLLMLPCAARADGSVFVMLVHPENQVGAASHDFLREAFLKRTTEWPGGTAIKPVDLRPNARVREAFSRRILGRSVAAVKSYWQQRIFSGRGVPPPELESDQAVVRYVTTNVGAVGYISSDSDPGQARPLTIR
jgi:hypothetical protein